MRSCLLNLAGSLLRYTLGSNVSSSLHPTKVRHIAARCGMKSKDGREMTLTVNTTIKIDNFVTAPNDAEVVDLLCRQGR